VKPIISPVHFSILLAVHCLQLPVSARAEETGMMDPDPVVVVASKAPRPMSAIAGQVSLIDAGKIEDFLLEGLDDLLRYEPGLNTETSGTRFGVSGVNIRGIGGNRVAIEVDGAPMQNRFALGSYSNGGQSLVETDRIKRLEVLHGPASSLYGSDALGGVMAFTTWDPDDLLARGQGSHWYGLRVGYQGQDDSRVASGSAAWATGSHGLLFSATIRDGHESDHGGSSDTPVDPQNWDSEDYFLRYTYDTQAANRLRFTVEDFQRSSLTQVNSILGYSRFRSTTALSGDDRDTFRRLQLDYEFSTDFWDMGIVRAYSTESETRQLTLEERANAREPSRYERYFQYETKLDGIELNLFRTMAWGATDHRIGAGIEYLKTGTEEIRDGFQQFLADGSITKTVLGETLPVRDFPNSSVDEWGLFIQDEISLGKGWELIPAVRWDRYDLDPEPDALYLEDYPDTEIVEVNEEEFTPRLGIVKQFDDGWNLYGQYVKGFRAPPHEDANIGLDISVFRFRAIPNPDLKSESSDGYEVGLRQFTRARRFSMAFFETDYDDFIESRAPLGIDPDNGYLLFQSRNINKARIRGFDMRLEQELGAWRDGLSDWTLNTALYWSEGDNLDNGEALNTVSPPQAVLGLSWNSPDQNWHAHWTGTFTRRQEDIDQSAGARFETPGYSVFDLSAGYRFNNRLDLNFGIRNLTDRHYWRWSDVSRLSPADPMLELLSRPGRSYSLSARLEW